MPRLSALLSLLLIACGADNADPDGDGVPNATDCDDQDPDIGAAAEVYSDSDGDGFGDSDTRRVDCPGPGLTREGGDCDDTDPATYPGAPEDCAEIDRDCDGDPALGATDVSIWYVDEDADGYGLTAQYQVSCEAPAGHALLSWSVQRLRLQRRRDARLGAGSIRTRRRGRPSGHIGPTAVT